MQARRKNSLIVSFLCPVELLDAVDRAVVEQQRNTVKAPLSGRSEWILRAIRRDLDHRQRSRRNYVHRLTGQRPIGSGQATAERGQAVLVPTLAGEADSLPGLSQANSPSEAHTERLAFRILGTILGSMDAASQTIAGLSNADNQMLDDQGRSRAEAHGATLLSMETPPDP